jgi:hypothetical protein
VSADSRSGSSVESGELVGSGERSRASSDMELCSDNSRTDIGKSKSYGRALERLLSYSI